MATSILEQVVQELHLGGCSGYLGRDKIVALVGERYSFASYRDQCCQVNYAEFVNSPRVVKRIQAFISHCRFHMLCGNWEDVTVIMAFIPGLPKTRRVETVICGRRLIMKDDFHFIPYSNIADAFHVVQLFFLEVLRLHGLPEMIVLDRDLKFMSYF